jgi:hypothetical protein
MTDTTTNMELADERCFDQISDQELETAAEMTHGPMFTLGACTGLSVCPA